MAPTPTVSEQQTPVARKRSGASLQRGHCGQTAARASCGAISGYMSRPGPQTGRALSTEDRGTGQRYPSVRTLHDALDQIEALGIVVIGLEGLNTDGINIIPSLDHIADFSAIE